MQNTIARLSHVKREEGQTLVEYALILATVSIGVTTAMLFLKGKLDSVFTTIANGI